MITISTAAIDCAVDSLVHPYAASQPLETAPSPYVLSTP